MENADYRKEFMENIRTAEEHTLGFVDYEEAGIFHKKAKEIYDTYKKQLSDLLPRLNQLEEVLGMEVTQ